MAQDWKPAGPPEDAGVLVHGPKTLAQAPGITAELERVQAHAGGLVVHLRWQANDDPAQTIRRLHAAHRATPVGQRPTGEAAMAHPVVHVKVAGLAGEVTPCQGHARSTEEDYVLTSRYWLNDAPAGAGMRLSVTWPATGLPASTTDVYLDSAPGL
jgi:hypothetical protein